MYKTIVVGFDKSPSSRAAVIEAANWIKRHGGVLYLVHAVFFDTEEFGIAPEQLDMRLKIGEKICIESKEMVAAEFGIDAHYVLCEGEAPEVLTEVSEGKKADLIVLGTYGRRGFNRFLMGSVTAQTIMKASSDVLVVKKPCEKCTGTYTSILVPFDGSEFSRKALERACQLSKIDGAEVTVLYVIPRYEEMIDFFKTDSIRNSLQEEAKKIVSAAVSYAESQKVIPKTEIAEGHAADRIVETAQKLNSDLIAMGSHGYHGMSKALMGSTTERVIMTAGCPILIVR